MGFLDSFNDEESKINSGTGRYRVMQVVLREKFVGKGSKNFREIEDLCNEQYAEGYRCIPSLSLPPDHRVLAAVTVPCATWSLNVWIKMKIH